MAKKSALAKNNRRILSSKLNEKKRSELRLAVKDLALPMSERFAAQLKLSKMPRDSSYIRVRNRCLLTGRPRGVYRRFGLSRICIRNLCAFGQIPGLLKSSW